MIDIEEVERAPSAGTACINEAMVAHMFDAPSDWPLMAVALRRLAISCNSASIARFSPQTAQLHEDICRLSANSPERASDLELLMSGRRTKHPMWTRLTGQLEYSELAFKLLGAEFCLAFTEVRQVRRSVMERVVSISADPLARDRNYVARIEAEARSQCSRRLAGVPPDVLRVNSVLRATVAVELESRNPEMRQGAAGPRTLPEPLLREVARWLHEQLDATSIVTIIGFVAGLTWDATKLVPLSLSDSDGDRWHVANVNVGHGVFRANLTGLLPGTKARPGCEDVTGTLIRPLPQKVAQRLKEMCARNPSAKCLGDLLAAGTSNRQEIGDFGPRITIAKFLASRGAAVLEAGIRREIGAYCVGAFGLIADSQHHYFTATQAELTQGSAQLYAWLGWCLPVACPASTTQVGSAVTPTTESVLALDARLAGRVEAMRVARRYTLDALLGFHSSYSVACAHRVAFFTLARAAKTYGFVASDWRPGDRFGNLIDKKAGPFGCATPLPMPVVLSTQIGLWLAHLHAMDCRLQKMGMAEQTDARVHIRRVLDGQGCELFFQISKDGRIKVLGSSDVFAGTGNKGDAYRHFVSNQLRAAGLASEIVEAASRHTVMHATVFSCASVAPPELWLRQAAQALDSVAAKLNMRPIAGLRRVVR